MHKTKAKGVGDLIKRIPDRKLKERKTNSEPSGKNSGCSLLYNTSLTS